MPSDVRKVSDSHRPSVKAQSVSGAPPQILRGAASLNQKTNALGKAEPFRTSGGIAAPNGASSPNLPNHLFQSGGIFQQTIEYPFSFFPNRRIDCLFANMTQDFSGDKLGSHLGHIRSFTHVRIDRSRHY